MKSLGQVGYDRFYWCHSEGKLSDWDQRHSTFHDAWEEAAKSIISAHAALDKPEQIRQMITVWFRTDQRKTYTCTQEKIIESGDFPGFLRLETTDGQTVFIELANIREFSIS